MFNGLRVLLDTQAFLELSVYGLENVSAATRRVVQDEETDILLSSISVTEITIKAAIGKLSFGAEQVSQGIKLLRITYIPYTPRHVQEMFRLPRVEGHRNPFDRMLIATALAENVPLVSSDKQFKRYKGLKVIR
jgi:PIN domain nuclease of toxin-antitoxin system